MTLLSTTIDSWNDEIVELIRGNKIEDALNLLQNRLECMSSFYPKTCHFLINRLIIIQRDFKSIKDDYFIVSDYNTWNSRLSGLSSKILTFLQYWKSEFERVNPKKIKIPVVVIAMLQEEANSLYENQSILRQLHHFPIQHWFVDKYHNTLRDHWIPFKEQDNNDNVIDIIEQYKNKMNAFNCSFNIEFKFYTEIIFSENIMIEDKIELIQNGALFIIDGLSLFNNKTKRILNKLNIGINQNIVQLIISPFDQRNINDFILLLEEQIENTIDNFLVKHDEELSPFHGFCIGNSTDLLRSIKASIEKEEFAPHLKEYIPEKYFEIKKINKKEPDYAKILHLPRIT